MGNAAATFDLRERADVRSVAAERTASIPWYVWCLAAATAADLFGGYWDISWHISIGRDTFWTPAHMMIYLAGVLAGVASGYAILSTTFGSSQEAKDSEHLGLGLSRAARMLHGGVGRIRDAHLGAVRQLVA